MLTLTTTVTGGQWFLPVLVLIFLNFALYQFAKMKQMDGLMKFLQGLEFLVFSAMLVLVWIIYAKGRTSLTAAGFITIIVIECLGNQFLDSRRDALKKNLGKKYPWLRFGFDLIVLLILGFIILSMLNYSFVAWIIVVLLILICAWIDFTWKSYK